MGVDQAIAVPADFDMFSSSFGGESYPISPPIALSHRGPDLLRVLAGKRHVIL